MQSDPILPPPLTGPWRLLYVGLGLFFVGLAVLGVFLPVLPTTPFLLLASYFLIRSSPRLHRWLLRSRLFGPLLRDWQRHRAVRRRVKVTATCAIPLVLGTSIVLTSPPPLVIAVIVGLGLIGLVVVLRLPVIDERAMKPEEACPVSDERPGT